MPGTKRSGIKIHMDRTVSKRPGKGGYRPGAGRKPQPREYYAPLPQPEGRKSSDAFRTLTDGVVLVRVYTDINHKVIEALNNQEHMRYSEQRHRTHTTSTQLAYLDGMIRNHHLPLGIFITNGHNEYTELVGTMGCSVDKHNKLLDMGLLILPEFASRSYGKRAWDLVKQWALYREGGAFQKVEAGHHEHNSAMLHICEMSGMRFEGRRYGHFLNDDGTRSAVIYWGQTP